MKKISILLSLLAILLMNTAALAAKNDKTVNIGDKASGVAHINLMVPGPDLNVFTTPAAFNAATSGATLTLEDFETITANFCVLGMLPLSSTITSGCYAPNLIQPGFTLDNNSTIKPAALYMGSLTAGTFGLPNTGVALNLPPEDTRFDFNPTVTAVNFNFTSPLGNDNYTIEVFNGTTSLGTTTVASNLATPVFVGLTTNNGTPITHITFISQSGTGSEVIMDLAFGQLAVPVAPIPTMGDWALVIFGLLILNIAIIFIRRKQDVLG